MRWNIKQHITGSIAVFGLAIALAACGGSGGGGGGGGGNGEDACNPTGTLTLGTISLAAPTGTCDYMKFTFSQVAYPSSVAFYASTNELGTAHTNKFGVMTGSIYDTYADVTTAQTYTIAADATADGEAELQVTMKEFDSDPGIAANTFICTAQGGSIDVDAFGAVDGKVTGTMNVTTWSNTSGTPAFGGTCPSSSVTGAFDVTRVDDDIFGNAGEANTMTLNRTGGAGALLGNATYTENSVTPYDPLIYGQQTGSHVWLRANLEANGTSRTREREIIIQVPLSPVLNNPIALVASPGVSNSGFTEFEETVSTTCTGTAGSVTLTAAGAAGNTWVGTLNVTSVSTSGSGTCPSAYTGSFTIKRNS